MHKARNVAPMSSSSSDDEPSDPEPPLSNMGKKCRKQRETSSVEYEISLIEPSNQCMQMIFQNSLIKNKNHKRSYLCIRTSK